MWTLQPAEPGTGTFYLLPGKEYVVGRKNCDILLANDQSISRVHAQLTVTEQTITLKDSSKYGTFVNDEQLATGSTKTVRAGDRLTFGVFQSKFRLELNSMVVCSSCVNNEGKAALSQAVQSVGGRLVNSWSLDCTYLVMPTVKVTIKTICALLCCRPIVKPEFFIELFQAVQRKETLPKAQNFKPEIDEPSLTKQDVDLDPREERKSLFKDKTFVFLNAKQMKRLSQAITCGGGGTQLLEDGSLPVSLLQSTGTCVIDVGTGASQTLIPPATKKWMDSVGQLLHRNGLRFIAESEIGLAAIYVSNQTYCNPCASPDSESVRMRPSIAASTLSQNATVEETVLAGASQNITAYVVNTEPSQGLDSRMDVSGPTAVGETPEKRTEKAKPLGATRPSFTSSSKPASTMEPPAPRSIPESSKSSLSSIEEVQGKSKGEPAPLQRFSGSQKNSFTLNKSPQKQSALTNFFQPVSKKRPREGSEEFELSEAKLTRRENEDEENRMKQNKRADALQTTSTSQAPASSHINQKHSGSPQHSDLSPSLGLGSGMGSGDGTAQSCDSSLLSTSKKRKEPVQDEPSDSAEPVEKNVDLDVSLEELESIMSEDMDEPVQPVASKKQRLDGAETSTARKRGDASFSYQTKQSLNKRNENLEPDMRDRTSRHQDSDKKPQASKRIVNLEKVESNSVLRKDRNESEDVKEEEVSFVVESKAQNGFIKDEMVQSKQEPKGSSSVSASENDSELPRRLLHVQFKSLTVSAPPRPRTGPLQSRDPNEKNFKRFRKVPVPGLQGLPNIIGGSDLVAHNRSKNSELEEWLRDAAQEEKRQEQEETLGDDLFRYNPKPSRRR